jgi:spermidine/putrescine transport system substrate-binding protein
VRLTCPLAAVLALILGACSRQAENAGPSGEPAASQKGRQVTVYMYSEYIDPEIPREFEKQNGVKVRIDVYEATEEMMAKLQQAGGASQYDVVVVSDHAIPVLAKLNLLQPLNHAKIPNARNVADRFRNPPYDRGCKYSLPYQWGTMGLMYRKDKLGQIAPSWAMIFDASRRPGPFVLIDSMRDMLAAALKYQGFSINTRKAEELKKAGDLVLAAKKSPKSLGFEGGVGGKNKVVAGNAALAIVYNGDAVRAMGEEKNVAFVLPREGTLIWVDAMTVPANAPNVEGAHRFINFMLDANVGARLSNFNQYATPNAASLPLIRKEDRENPAIYPTDEQMKKMEYLEDVGKDTKLYDEVWTAVKSR